MSPAPPPTPGVYLEAFSYHEGDGWFGNLEIRIEGFAALGPYSRYYDTPVTIFEDRCSFTSYVQNDVETHRWYDINKLFLSASSFQGYLGGLGCRGQPGFFVVEMWEDDGGFNGHDDNYGTRAWVNGFFPGGANYGENIAHYRNTYDTWDRTAESRLRLR